MRPRGSDAVAEAFVVAVVIVVLGVAAVRTKAEPPDDAAITKLAAQVRMSSPIAQACVPSLTAQGRSCDSSDPSRRR